MTTAEFIRLHRADNVVSLALQASRYNGVDMPFALNQIAGWQMARTKMPSWAAIEGMVYPPHLNIEQSSGEAAARYKAAVATRWLRQEAGDRPDSTLVDLTGGFGVDFSFLSQAFSRAVYVERDERLCDIARHNFALLGLRDVEVVSGDGVAYLHRLPPVGASTGSCGEFRMVFLDPARRDADGHKVFAMEQCTPDVVDLRDELLCKADVVMVKLSPMLDWHEAVRKLEPVSEVHVVSVRNECKELLLVLSRHDRPLTVTCVNDGQVFCYEQQASTFSAPLPTSTSTLPISVASVSSSAVPMVGTSSATRFLLVPNSSVMKAGCFKALELAFPVTQLDVSSHLFIAEDVVVDFPGRQFRIEAVATLNKKSLRQAFGGVKRANVAVRNFPLSAEALRKRLRVSDGGDLYVFGTTVNGMHQLYLTRKI